MANEAPIDVLETSKDAFIQLISKLNDDQLHAFNEFAHNALDEYHRQLHDHAMDEHSNEESEEHDGSFQPVHDAKMKHLARMIKELRTRVPISAEAPYEQITIPEGSEYEGYNSENTVHVDGFLFADDEVDELCDEGKLSRNYCLDCQSRRVAPLNFISHSASVLQLQFLYQVALANKVKDKVIVDIGSRLGAVLYTGHLFTGARKLIGVEINAWFADLQKDMIRRYKMQDRIEVVCNDIRNTPELLEQADVVIMNNVFQFFCDLSTQQEIWKFIRAKTMKRSGLLIVTLPSLQEQLKEAKLPSNILMRGWVKEVKLRYEGGWFEDIHPDEVEEIKTVHMYRVL